MTSLAHIWDNAQSKSSSWISDLSDELGWANAPLTLLAMRAVLHALRDRLPPDEAVELSAQMPLIIKGVYFDGWDPSATPRQGPHQGRVSRTRENQSSESCAGHRSGTSQPGRIQAAVRAGIPRGNPGCARYAASRAGGAVAEPNPYCQHEVKR
jgi:uncharacterized protein (DUF2267 family)